MDQQPQPIDKKTIAAIVLCAVVWAVWMVTSMSKQQQMRTAALAAKAQAAAVAASNARLSMAGGTATPGEPAMVVTSAATSVATAPAVPEKRVTLSNKVLDLELSNHGARPVWVDLKNYRSSLDTTEDAGLVELVERSNATAAPLAPWFGDGNASVIPADAPFEKVAEATNEVSFKWTGSNGLQLTRTFDTDPDDYLLTMVEKLENVNPSGGPAITGRPGVIWAARQRENPSYTNPDIDALASVNGRRQFQYPKKIKTGEPQIKGGPVDWIGVDDRYFVAAIAPVEPTLAASDAVYFLRTGDKTVGTLGLAPAITLQPGGSKTFRYEMYLGPKDYPVLLKAGHHFDRAIDWGWWWMAPISKALWYFLRWIQTWAKNWGLAIIILTIVIRGALSPLAARQMKMANEFSRKSQKFKPDLDRLKAKYKDDPMRLNQETMALYKQHGMSPFSQMAGCLPMVLQLPIWYALYRVLRNSFDLRQAPFALWIRDLSAPAPVMIAGFPVPVLALLLGAVMWVQMLLTPASPGVDPKQQKMMQMMMPVIFVISMRSLPSGLVLYILTSTIINVAQQYYLRQIYPPASTTPPLATQREAT